MDAITNLILGRGRALVAPGWPLVITAVVVAVLAFVVATTILAPEAIASGAIDIAPFRW